MAKIAAKKTSKAAAKPKAAAKQTVKVPDDYRVPKKYETDTGKSAVEIRKYLEKKSGGKCDLGGEMLPDDAGAIQIDHEDPQSAGGSLKLSNLWLVCAEHNKLKSNMPREFAKPWIRLRDFCLEGEKTNYDQVVRKHLGLKLRPFEFERTASTITFYFQGAAAVTSPLFEDPSTKVEYCFVEAPAIHIFNDEKSQPRWIMSDHVRALAWDFRVRPVHEPSSSRLLDDGGGTGRRAGKLLQFDGQHKGIAQLILGRKKIQMKVYITSDLQMLRELVEAIQNRIVKRPLSKSATLIKIEQIIGEELRQWAPKAGTLRSEKAFIESRELEARTLRRQQLLDALRKNVMDAPENRLRPYVQDIKLSGRILPMTDKNLIKHLINRFMTEDLLEEDMTSEDSLREIEKKNIALLFSTVADEMFSDWDSSKVRRVDWDNRQLRGYNFSLGGAMGWWGRVLVRTLLHLFTLGSAHEKRILLRKLTKKEERRLKLAVKVLCSWDLWTNPPSDLLAAWRSNTLKRVDKAMRDEDLDGEYNESKLARDVLDALDE